MDSERVILVAGITAIAAVVGSFILWGPSTSVRPKKRSSIIGLQNLGLTCYLNSLLQAMASCHYFLEWLNLQENKGEVTTAMRKLLNVLSGNGHRSQEEEYFVSPVEVVTALNHSGWKITNSQQDVHELLCNLITILEEEAHKSCVDLVITVNAVRKEDNEEILEHIPNGSVMEAGLPKEAYKINKVHANNADLNSCNKLLIDGVCCEGDGDISVEYHQSRLNYDRMHAKIKNCTIKKRVAHDVNQSPRPSPFRGYLTNKLECTECNYKSVLRYDKFDSISLHLPEPNNQNVHTLGQLLNNFVKNEIIPGITCEGCNKNHSPDTELVTAPAIKLLRFGKLPACLCIHIVRTSFHEFGVYKRQDYVDFPEYIAMDPYLYKPRRRNVLSFRKNSDEVRCHVNGSIDEIRTKSSSVMKHIYRLKAVIVHRGSHNDGHFMTYRRGTGTSKTQHRCSESRWYLVSDTEVKETTLYNVLTSVAYVLFYEKCSGLS